MSKRYYKPLKSMFDPVTDQITKVGRKFEDEISKVVMPIIIKYYKRGYSSRDMIDLIHHYVEYQTCLLRMKRLIARHEHHHKR